MTLSQIKQHISDKAREAIKAAFSISDVTVPALVFPPNVEMGDFALEAFALAKPLRRPAVQVAGELAAAFSKDEVIDSIAPAGPYVNFKIKPEVLFGGIIEEILNSKHGVEKSGRRVMVEYLSPNTNKPLHLAHLRNGVIGMALSRLLEASGDEVIKVSIINDRGIHICKAMLAWQKWGNGETPEATGEKGDHFVGRWYVRFSQEEKTTPALTEEAQVMLQKWEKKDPEVVKLWQQMRQWVLSGINQTNKVLGFQFDLDYFESDVYEQGKDIVEQGLAKKVFHKNDKGNAVYDLPLDKFGKDEAGKQRLVTVLRPDGTSLYSTQDLGLAVKRMDEYHLDQLIYVVGSEQNYHFQTLFAMLAALGYEWANKLYHLSYAMVYLPEGKMKSREGTVVDADDLVGQMQELAEAEVQQREDSEDLEPEDLVQRSVAIALAAIKFYLLRTKPTNDIYFDPKESISFEGFTGPYCQYSYARAMSILRQAAEVESAGATPVPAVAPGFAGLGSKDERQLLQKLAAFPQVIQRAAAEHNPAHLATHIFETAQTFNQFYGSSPVLKAEAPVRAARLLLVQASAASLRRGLELLGIKVLEEM